MITASNNAELGTWRNSLNEKCAFVPTMGALHEGHAELIRQAAAIRGSATVVSIFVNPTQFDDPRDFDRYPKTLEADLAMCERAGAACVYVPGVRDVYETEADRAAPVRLPAVAELPRLEDAARPGHFAGVYQVVRLLFQRVRPHAALFGEKDWQQLQVVRAMVEMEGMEGLEIVGVPTVREADGLAMSSRNRFLTAKDREIARSISRALVEGRKGRSPQEAERIMRWHLARVGIEPDYAVVRDGATLGEAGAEGLRAVIAARVGAVRLLDNGPWSACAE